MAVKKSAFMAVDYGWTDMPVKKVINGYCQ